MRDLTNVCCGKIVYAIDLSFPERRLHESSSSVAYKNSRIVLEMFLVLADAALDVSNRFHVHKFPARIKLHSPSFETS